MNHPTPLALSHTWYTAHIAVTKLVQQGKAIPSAIRRVAEQKKLPDTFVQWCRASFGLSAKLCNCPKPRDGNLVRNSDCLQHGEIAMPEAWVDTERPHRARRQS